MPAAVVQFVSRLWRLLEEAPAEAPVHWADDGKHFCVCRPELFAKDLLPVYYSHGNLSSFVRQLNLYGFRKLSTMRNVCPRVEEGALRYQHPRFARHRPDDLHLVKRRAAAADREQRRASKSSAASSPDEPASEEALSAAFAELRNLSGEQLEWEGRLGPLAEQSGQISAELADLLAAHRRQRDVVDRLLGLFSDALDAKPPASEARDKGSSSLPSIRVEEGDEEDEEDEVGVERKRPRLAPEAEEVWAPALGELEEELRLAAPLRPVGGWPAPSRPRNLLPPKASTSPTPLCTSGQSSEASPAEQSKPSITLTRPSAEDFSQFLSRVETSLSSLGERFAVPEPPSGSVPHRLTEILAGLPSVCPSSESLGCGASASHLLHVPDPSTAYASASSTNSADDASSGSKEPSTRAQGGRPLFCLPPWELEELDDSSTTTEASSFPHSAAVV